MILGDNAAGKTALLQTIAIGLCDEASAAGLIKESEEGYIRRGERSAFITVELRRSTKSKKIYSIRTEIKKIKTRAGTYERVRKITKPTGSIPWQSIFICAYGAGRGTSGTGDIAGYSTINAVYNLFNYREGLQNPELTIRRLENDNSKVSVLEALEGILLGSKSKKTIELPSSGITVDGPWGNKMPFRDLADGYKSTLLWVTDFLGWALSQKPSIRGTSEITGIVLIDELEQHLHATWQDRIVTDLRSHFPKVQFITTTHSPIVASSVGQIKETVDRDNLIFLAVDEGNIVVGDKLPSMKGWRADQVLASKGFKYLIQAAPDWDDILYEASILASKGERRNKKEQHRYEQLKTKIAENFIGEGHTEIERQIQNDLTKKMRETTQYLERKLFGNDDD